MRLEEYRHRAARPHFTSVKRNQQVTVTQLGQKAFCHHFQKFRRSSPAAEGSAGAPPRTPSRPDPGGSSGGAGCRGWQRDARPLPVPGNFSGDRKENRTRPRTVPVPTPPPGYRTLKARS